ncbi:MAG: ECF transporter S component [Thermoleophilia bacterium]|nr:ECF transporter S component [Thermoleophilia bacterium]
MPRRPHRIHLAIVAAALGFFAAGAWAALDPSRAGLSLLLAALALVIGGAAWLETGAASAKELALIATLGAVAAAGRVLFAAVPGVQPVTVIAVAAGAALGMRAGIGVGAIAAFASNFVLGQGIWTPWQMLAWSACGAAGALLAPILTRRLTFALVCFVLGFAFSGLMDVWEWFSFFPHTWQAFALQMARGFPFQAAHAVGNLLIALAIGPELRRVLERYGRRLHVEVSWA